jgi:hypothetical protein
MKGSAMTRLCALLLAALMALAGTGADAQPQRQTQPAQQVRQPQMLPDAPGLFRRVIVRPGTRLAQSPAAVAPSAPVPGFSVFYVYGERTDGQQTWLEVGPALDGRTTGWLPEVRTIAWRQTMVVAFTSPANRPPAMFFREGDTPRALWMDTAGRAAEAARLRAAAEAGRGDGKVIALEPRAQVNILEQFYLLPILAHRTLENEQGQTAVRLEVVSAPATPPPPPVADDAAFQNFRGALVFVIDTTISMAPYIERTRQVVRDVVTRLRGTEVGDRFRFGMVAFRDHLGTSPPSPNDYVARLIAAPNLDEPPDAVLPRIDLVEEAKVSNDAYDEDAIAGLKLAIDGIDWSRFGGRYVVLITDAGTRDANDQRSATGLGVDEIRAMAQHEANRLVIATLHIRAPAGRNNHARAQRQYTALTRQRDERTSLYIPIADGDEQRFQQAVEALTSGVLDDVGRIIGRPVGQPPAAETPEQRRIREQMASVGQAVRLAYVGEAQRQTVPDVVRSFVLDQDFEDPSPARRPLEPRVLLTKGQLSDISETMRVIIESYEADRLDPRGFFDRLRGAMGATFADPRRIPASQSAEFGSLFGAFLDNLPYKSQFAETTLDEFREWGGSRRRDLVFRLERLRRLYAEFNRENRYWHQLEGTTNPADAVFPLPLSNLP